MLLICDKAKVYDCASTTLLPMQCKMPDCPHTTAIGPQFVPAAFSANTRFMLGLLKAGGQSQVRT